MAILEEERERAAVRADRPAPMMMTSYVAMLMLVWRYVVVEESAGRVVLMRATGRRGRKGRRMGAAESETGSVLCYY